MRLKRQDKINVICDYILDFVLKKKVLLKDGLKVCHKESVMWLGRLASLKSVGRARRLETPEPVF